MKNYDLSEKELRELLNSGSADVGTDGTGLYSQTNKIALNSGMYTLIIGIGGTGCHALRNIKQYMLNNVRDYSRNVALLAVDADTGELDNSILDPNREVIRVSVKVSDANWQLNIPENRSEEVKEWINPNYHVTHDDKGANRIRQAGRGKLYTRNENGQTNDQMVIDKMVDIKRRLGNVGQVFIVAGLSGGSGSGMFINIAMLTKIALGDSTEIKAFCFLPDTMEEMCDANERKTLYSNGYAALKEIDYYAGLTQRAGFTDTFTSSGGRTVKLSKDNLLFSSVTLINGSSNRQSFHNARDKAMDVFVESAVNMLVSGYKTTVKDGKIVEDQSSNQTVLSFLSNAFAERMRMLDQAVQKSGLEKAGWYLDDNFCYSGIGVASASIPQKVCTSYIVSSVMKKIFNIDGLQTATASLFQEMPILPESSARAAIYSITGNNQTDFSYRDVDAVIAAGTTVTTPDELEISREDLISNSLDAAREAYGVGKLRDKAEQAADEAIEKKFNTFRKNAIDFIKKNGPRALVALYDGKAAEGDGVVPYKTQKSMRAMMLEQVPNDFHDESETARTRLKRETEHKILWINAPNQNRAKKYLTDLISAELKRDVWQHVYGKGAGKNAIQNGYIDKVEDFINECRWFEQLLGEFGNIYRNLSISFDSLESFREASDSSANINIIYTEEAYRWAKGRLDEVIGMIDSAETMSDIVDDFFSQDHMADWRVSENLSGKKLNARIRFEKVISERIRKANDNKSVVLTINDYITHCLSAGTQSLERIMRDIAEELINHSDPLFKKSDESRNIKSPSHVCVVFPKSVCTGSNGADICTAFTSSLGSEVNFYMSDANDKIVFYKLEPSNPLYSLAGLKEWESAYESSSLMMIHMNESGLGDFDPVTGIEWKNYPTCRCNIDVRSLPESQKRNSLEYRFLTNEFDPMFDKAIGYGIIREKKDPNGGVFYTFHSIYGEGWNYDMSDYDGIDDFGMPLTGEPLIDYIRARNVGRDGVKIELSGNEVLTKPYPISGEYTQGEAKKRAKRALRRNVRMYIELKRSVLKYEEMFKDISEGSNENMAIIAFIELIGAGLISRNNDKNGSFELVLDSNVISIIVPTKFNKINWQVDLLKLYDGGYEYAAAFKKFRELYSDGDKLKNITVIAKKAWDDQNEKDPTGESIEKRLIELHEEVGRFDEASKDGTDSFCVKLGLDIKKFAASGIIGMYDICRRRF